MAPGIRLSKHVPSKLPFKLRTSKAKAALMMLVVAVIVEPVFLLLIAVNDPAPELSFRDKQIITGVLLLLCWVTLAFRRPTFGLDDTGMWLQLGTRKHTVFVPWSEVARVEQVRLQWQTSLGVSLHDPSVLGRDRLVGASASMLKALDEATGTARGTHPPCDVQVSLTTANRSVAEVSQALARFAPPGLPWQLALDPAGLGKGSKATRVVGRVVLGIVWIALFLAGISALVWAVFGVAPDTPAGMIVAFASASAGAATLSWIYGHATPFPATAFTRPRGFVDHRVPVLAGCTDPR